jgi:hypothetical protein
MVFTSGDRLHARLTHLFADLGQAFLWAPDLKASLRQVAEYCERHEREIMEAGLIGFLSHPPTEIENPVSALWDRFLPRWREPRSASPSAQPPDGDELLNRIKHMTDNNDTLDEGGWTDDPDFVVVQSRIPVSRGKWRLVPEGIEERSAEAVPVERERPDQER